MTDPVEFVRQGYDALARRYPTDDADRHRLTWVERALGLASIDGVADVLELGCGPGVPVARFLVEAGHRYTGVDLSAGQLQRARTAVPQGRFIRANFCQVDLPAASFDIVISLYAIFHLPRQHHGPLLARIAGWLRLGGVFVATFGCSEWEGVEPFLGDVPMYWSHFDASTNEQLVTQAGLVVRTAEMIEQVFDDQPETHLWVLATAPSA